MSEQAEARMSALIDQALAQLRREPPGSRLVEIHLDLYTGMAESVARLLFAKVAHGTPAEHAVLIVRPSGSRYICWNCCGLRFEGWEGVCPNCGEEAIKVPDEIPFALYKVKTTIDA